MSLEPARRRLQHLEEKTTQVSGDSLCSICQLSPCSSPHFALQGKDPESTERVFLSAGRSTSG